VLTGAGHDRLTLPNGAESRGHVTLDELVELYRSASALVYPSLYEGFGIPCVRGDGLRRPVAAANVASIPEVCDDAPSTSTRSIRGRSPRDPLRPRPAAVRGGIEQAARFTWDECARRHERSTRELAGTG
jgi:glycosyltransferase involved in cell wall biosynthesis